MTSSYETDILVLGASFAGLEFVHQLERSGYFRRRPKARVVVVDKVDQASYLPLIHEELFEPPEFANPVKVRSLFDRLDSVQFVRAEVKEVDFRQRSAELCDGRVFRAERLVVALGSVLAAPASVDPEKRAWVLKSGQDRLRLSNKIESLGPNATIAVIGGGLSGVELAAELAYRQPKTQRVHLVHAQDKLNCGEGPRVDRLSQERLRALGVELCLGQRVTSITAQGLELRQGDGPIRPLQCDLVCWAGGVRGPASVRWVGTRADHAGWLKVDPCLRVRNEQGEVYEHCFAMGDLAAICLSPGDPPVQTMRRAIEAFWQAKTLAASLSRPNRPPKPHPLRLSWPHGVSLGPASLVCYRRWVVDFGGLGRWFRRFLGRMFLRRYHMPPWRRS